VWSLKTRTRVRPAARCKCGADGSALSRDAEFATFGTADAHVLFWDVSSAKLVADETVSTELGDHVYGTAVSLDGTRVLAGTASGQVLAWEPRSDTSLDPIRPSGQPIVRAEATDDGRLFLVEGQKAGFKVGHDRWLIRISGS
jgi:hypothetical protein